MQIKVGDTIRADAGGGAFWNGTVDSIGGGKIRVKIPTGHIIEVELRGNHTINGKKPVDPVGAAKKLTELDSATNLSEWEKEFVGDLMDMSAKHFSPKQEEMINIIYKRRIEDA